MGRAFMPFLRRRSTTADNKRANGRVRPPRNSPVQVQIIGRRSLDIVNARDISESGVGVYLPHDMEDLGAGTEVELVISLPGVRPFSAHGAIRHVTEGRDSYFGVEFTRLANESRDHLSQYVTSRSADRLRAV